MASQNKPRRPVMHLLNYLTDRKDDEFDVRILSDFTEEQKQQAWKMMPAFWKDIKHELSSAFSELRDKYRTEQGFQVKEVDEVGPILELVLRIDLDDTPDLDQRLELASNDICELRPYVRYTMWNLKWLKRRTRNDEGWVWPDPDWVEDVGEVDDEAELPPGAMELLLLRKEKLEELEARLAVQRYRKEDPKQLRIL